jgi:hypothetical protein
MRNLGSERRVTKLITGGSGGALAMLAMQSAAYAQAKPTGLAAYESLLTGGFFGLLLAFIGLIAWEVIDGKKASRSSLDIAKLAAAAAKKQSAASAPSGSLAQLDAPPTSRPFAPPPPPPPPKQPSAEPSMEQASPFAPPPPREDAPNPFAAPPAEMIGGMGMGSMGSLESTVAFSPTGDAGSSGGWADLLQRVRAGEPEAASFQDSSPPPLTEDESFVLPTGDPQAGGSHSPASSSEAWEALLKRTTTGESPKAPKAPIGDVGKISLASNFQLPGEAAPAPIPPPPSPFGGMGGGAAFGSAEEPAPPSNIFASNFDDGGATFPSAPPPFSLPGSMPGAPPPVAPEPSLGSSLGMGFSFSSDPTSEPASPFGGGGFGGGFAGPSPGAGGSGGFAAPSPGAGGSGGFAAPSPGAGGSGGFESPSFKLPGSPAPTDDFGGGGSGGFQLPTGGGGFGAPANPFDFGGANDSPSSSTLPLSDLFSSKPGAGGPPSFQLPSGGGGTQPLDFGSGLDSDAGGNPGLGRTISLDFAKGGGQKPPPPLPKTEG